MVDHKLFYRLIGIEHQAGRVLAKVQEIGSPGIGSYALADCYQPGMLNHFSRDDALRIAALMTAEQTENHELIKSFRIKTPANRNSIIVVGIIFSACLILSNLTAMKLVDFYGLTITAGLAFFPLTYIFDDILTEVYGFKVSRRVIWSALLANFIVVLGTTISIRFTPSPYWHDQSAYATIYAAVPRIYLASILAYLAGEFTNSIILAKLKVATLGKHLWLRALTSTGVGTGVDSLVFCLIAFTNTMPFLALFELMMVMYAFKMSYEVIALPMTYKIANYLKRVDNVDHYDFQTKFNPFSLRVD